MKNVSPDTKLIAVEPKGAPALFESNKKGEVVILEKIDKFVDGAAAQKIGEETFKTLETVVDDILLVPEGKGVHRDSSRTTNARLSPNLGSAADRRFRSVTGMKLKEKMSNGS